MNNIKTGTCEYYVFITSKNPSINQKYH